MLVGGLSSTLVIAGGVALAAWGAWRVFGGYSPVGFRPSTLSRRELGFVSAAADAVYPAGGEVPPSGTEAGIPSHVDRYMTAVQPSLRLLMRLLFFLVEHATLIFGAPGLGGRRRFSSLTPEQRIAVLEGWQRSTLAVRRLVFTSLRALLSMGYFADPAVLRALRLAPYEIEPRIVEADLLYPRVGQPLESIAYTRDDLTPPDRRPPLDLDGPLRSDFAEPGA